MLERMFGVISKRADTRLSEPNLSTVVRCKKSKQEVELLNISSIGLRFKSNESYEMGEKLWFDIRSNEEKPLLSLSIKGKIINDYGKSDDNLHSYGKELVDHIQKMDVARVLMKLTMEYKPVW